MPLMHTLSGGLHPQRLVTPACVVRADPIADHSISSCRVLKLARPPRSSNPTARQMPSEQLSAMTIHCQGQRCPAIYARPDAAQIGRPSFVRGCHHRGHRPHARTESHGLLLHLPSHQLENSLNRVPNLIGSASSSEFSVSSTLHVLPEPHAPLACPHQLAAHQAPPVYLLSWWPSPRVWFLVV